MDLRLIQHPGLERRCAPPGALHVAARPVVSVHSVAGIRRRHDLRIAVIPVVGALHIGLCSDPAVVPGLAVTSWGAHDVTPISAAVQ